MRSRTNGFRWLVLAFLAAPLAGCPKDDPARPDDPDGYTTPNEAAAAWAAALTARDLAAVEKLLEPDSPGRAAAGFRFYPRSEDVDDFPWMAEESWSRDEELGMLGHMMDSTYVSPVNGNSVDSIDAELQILSVTETAEGALVLANATFQVLWAENSGAISVARLEMLLVTDGEGHYVMRSMRERPPVREAGPWAEASSWGSIKQLYR